MKLLIKWIDISINHTYLIHPLENLSISQIQSIGHRLYARSHKSHDYFIFRWFNIFFHSAEIFG